MARTSRLFLYLRDPLFLFCVVLYFVNRLALKPLFHGGIIGSFCHESLNDLICFPFWLPILIWAMRRIGLRREDTPPRGLEVMVPLILWAWVFEVLLPGIPFFRPHMVGDPSDILWYSLGAIGAMLFWESYYTIKTK